MIETNPTPKFHGIVCITFVSCFDDITVHSLNWKQNLDSWTNENVIFLLRQLQLNGLKSTQKEFTQNQTKIEKVVLVKILLDAVKRLHENLMWWILIYLVFYQQHDQIFVFLLNFVFDCLRCCELKAKRIMFWYFKWMI